MLPASDFIKSYFVYIQVVGFLILLFIKDMDAKAAKSWNDPIHDPPPQLTQVCFQA